MKLKLCAILLCIFMFFPSVGFAQSYSIRGLNVTVSAIMYHRVTENPDEWDDYNISPTQLEDDIKSFLDAGFTPISISEYIYMTSTFEELRQKMWRDTEKLLQLRLFLETRQKPLLITFDDGYKDGYTLVFPLLKKYNVCANFFIVGSYSNSGNSLFLNPENIKEMYDSGLAEFGNHSYELHNLTPYEISSLISKPNALELSNVGVDYLKNSDFLEDILGFAPSSVSYPYGVHSPYSEMLLDLMGVTATYITEDIPFKTLSDGMRKITRVNRSSIFSSKDFVNLISKKLEASS